MSETQASRPKPQTSPRHQQQHARHLDTTKIMTGRSITLTDMHCLDWYWPCRLIQRSSKVDASLERARLKFRKVEAASVEGGKHCSHAMSRSCSEILGERRMLCYRPASSSTVRLAREAPSFDTTIKQLQVRNNILSQPFTGSIQDLLVMIAFALNRSSYAHRSPFTARREAPPYRRSTPTKSLTV